MPELSFDDALEMFRDEYRNIPEANLTSAVEALFNQYGDRPNAGLRIHQAVMKVRLGPKIPHIFQGEPDARQAKTAIEPSRFRPRYRPMTEEEKALHDAIKAKAAELEAVIEQVKPGRYRSLGMTALEESVMWAVKELTA